ncbi:hypothetical protein [Aurantimonas sp. Leaf443]|uniref:hypothetical protein n=1 Tax=Aurantimonas sp. Leaf443 TaxID=1736378 RepID=UPI0006F4F34A|nr:hypothetical protein [Aurantimonas sp. Leaf443]KQT85287.1 hypothetical protein ASG48_08500 [Aurantimonas sp. Leaf443]
MTAGQFAVVAETGFPTPKSAALRWSVLNAGTLQEAMRLRGNGDLGIGTPTPKTRLDVDGPVRPKAYTVATLPAAAGIAGAIVHVADESGGPVPAFSDGTVWRRMTDRAVVS